jgi:hypothetical protein
MIVRKNLAVIAFLTLWTLAGHAQLRIPSFDVAIKPGYLLMFDDLNSGDGNSDVMYETLTLQGELNVHITQHIAIGGFYQRNIIISNYHSKEQSSDLDQAAKHLFYGAALRLSTGRATKFRPYASLRYFHYETIVDYESFTLAGKGNAASFAAGLMLRLGHNFYLTLVEAEICQMLSASDVLFEKKSLFPQFHAGLSYNFSKRK